MKTPNLGTRSRDVHKICAAINKLIEEKKSRPPIIVTADEIEKKISKMKL